MIKGPLHGNDFKLVSFKDHHLTDRYVSWLNDPEITVYSELKHRVHTKESCREYVKSFDAGPNQLFALETDKFGHVGNLAVYYDLPNGRAELSILIGEKIAWGNGFGIQSFRLVIEALRDVGEIRKVTAGYIAKNKASEIFLERLGFQIEARVPRHFLWRGQEVDLILTGLYL